MISSRKRIRRTGIRNAMNSVLQYVLYVGILVVFAIPLGFYMSKVMDGEKAIVSRVLGPVERGIYKFLRIDPEEDMGWKKYLAASLLFNLFGFIVLLLILLFQGYLPWNPQHIGNLSWHLAFNTAASGIAVLWCLIRGLTHVKKNGVGNFWKDLTRCTLYILLPICLVSTIVLTQQGVPQTLSGNQYVDLVEPIAVDAEGNELKAADIDVANFARTV